MLHSRQLSLLSAKQSEHSVAQTRQCNGSVDVVLAYSSQMQIPSTAFASLVEHVRQLSLFGPEQVSHSAWQYCHSLLSSSGHSDSGQLFKQVLDVSVGRCL